MKDKILDLFNKGYSYNEIHNALGCSKGTISYYCSKLENDRIKIISSETILKIKKLYSDGVSIKDIRFLLGVSAYSITKYKDGHRNGHGMKKKSRSLSVIEWRQRMKIKAVEYKGGKCEKCGYDKNVAAMEFHHKNPSEKDFGISTGCTMGWVRLKKELDKCSLFCANCHREEHHKDE